MGVCDGMIKEMENNRKAFRSKRRTATGEINKSKNDIDELKNEPLNDVNDVKNGINDSKNEVDGDMNETQNAINTYTGSCLDGINDKLDDLINNIGETLKNILPDSMMETNILGILNKLRDLLNKLNISGLIKKLDELLGCLSDSNCLPVSELDDLNTEINNFINFAGLSPEGDWDAGLFLDVADVPQNVKDGILQFSNDIDELEKEVTETIKKTSETIKSDDADVEIKEELI